jgi:phosphatidylglycerophosphatase C
MEALTSVVFDLDGTLLDGDSTTAWMVAKIRRSWWRTALALTVSPFAALLMTSSRRWGASAFLWIASVGLNERALRASFRTFAVQVHAGDGAASWRAAGVQVLRDHIFRGERVVLATAAPAWLAEVLFERLGLQIEIVGSVLSPFWGGWIGSRHCRHHAKCEALAQAGHGQRWSIAYSDSADDWPLLARADKPRLVNGSQTTIARLAKIGIAVEPTCW